MMKKKIIHILLGKANPNRMNGVNRVVNNLAIKMNQQGKNCEVWGITPTPNDRSDLPERNYETHLFQSMKSKWQLDPTLKTAVANLKEEVIFHFHGGFIPAFFQFARLLKANNIEYIVTPHGCYNQASMQNNKFVKYTYFYLFEKSFLQNSKALHCLGKSEVNAAKRLAPKVNTVVIPNGQMMEELAFEFENIAVEGAPIFSFCGRMDKKMKGLDLLLAGFKKYRQEMNGNGLLWLIGGDYQFEELQQTSKEYGIDKHVKFWNKQFGNDKLNILANSDAFYHPSRYEGMPTAILEAAGLKLPCIVSDATNMLEYIEDHSAGITLHPNSADSVADSMLKIEYMKADGTISVLGNNAFKMVTKVFSWDAVANQLSEVYTS